jgi:hypothetical protein
MRLHGVTDWIYISERETLNVARLNELQAAEMDLLIMARLFLNIYITDEVIAW